jgi:MYXO-CTERM domain-containing protein
MSRFVSLRSILAVSVCLAGLASSSAAKADLAPPNECNSPDTAGSACTTAGPNFNDDGVCVATTCMSASPPPNGSTYACVLCQLADAGPTNPPDASSEDASTPKNACPIETLGQTCDKAGPGFNQAGICAEGPCDNGNTCSLCQLADGGAAKDAGTKKDAATAKDAATSKDAAKGEDASDALASSSGCAVAPHGASPVDGAWFFGLGAVGLAWSAARRRRQG